MDVVSPPAEAPPGWPRVAVTAGICIGVLPALFGFVFAVVVAPALDGCGAFGDVGCGAYWGLGVLACPGTALGSAFVAGVTTVRMTKSNPSQTRRQVWKQSLGAAFFSLFVSGPLSLGLLSLLHVR